MTETLPELLESFDALIQRIDRYEVCDEAEIRNCVGRIEFRAAGLELTDAELADRIREAIKIGMEFGLVRDPLGVDASFPRRDLASSARLKAIHYWRCRDHKSALTHFEHAIAAVDPAFEPVENDLKAQDLRNYARVMSESDRHPEAIEALEKGLALTDLNVGTEARLKLAFKFLTDTEFDQEFVDSYLSAPPERILARDHVLFLYVLLEYITKFASSNSLRESVSAELLRVAFNTGAPWYKFTSGLARVKTLRTIGRLEDALEVMRLLSEVRLKFGQFDSEHHVRSDRGLILMNLGRFTEAQVDIAHSLSRSVSQDDPKAEANLLTIRSAIWLAEGNVPAAATSIEMARSMAGDRSDSGAHLLGAVSAILIATSDRSLAVKEFSKTFQVWNGSGNPAAVSLALALDAAFRRDVDAIDTARKEATKAGPQFMAVVDACDRLIDRDSDAIPNGNDLCGSVVGVAVSGWLAIEDESGAEDRLSLIEDGLFRIDGETVDLRRRKALKKIVDSMRANPGKTYDVIDLFSIGWSEDRLPTTVSERVYFAIYELRRLGFREFIETAEDGYIWSEENKS